MEHLTCGYGVGPATCTAPAVHRVHWGEGTSPSALCAEHTSPIYEDQKDPDIGPYIKIRPLKETNG